MSKARIMKRDDTKAIKKLNNPIGAVSNTLFNGE